jgi:hypothetical protein
LKQKGLTGIDRESTFFELMQAVLALEALKYPRQISNGENPFFALAGLVPAEANVEVALAA